MKNEPWTDYYKDVEGRPSKNYDRIAQLLRKAGVDRILDLGCGNGRHTIPLASDGFTVYGFDRSKIAVATTKKKLRAEGLEANIRVGDMLKPFPYPDGFFDAVLASRVMYHTTSDNIKRTVNEVGRILKNGGYVYFEGPTNKKVTMSKLGLSHKINGVLVYPDKTEVEPGTYLTVYPGASEQTLYHIFRSREEVIELFNEFKILQLDFRGRTLRMLARKSSQD